MSDELIAHHEFGSKRIGLESLRKGETAKITLISGNPDVHESATVSVISPRRRLLTEPTPVYTPLQIELQREDVGEAKRLAVLGQAKTQIGNPPREYPTLMTADIAGAPKRSDHIADLAEQSTLGIPYDNMEVIENGEDREVFVEDDEYKTVRELFNQYDSAAQQQRDSDMIRCQDGKHVVFVDRSQMKIMDTNAKELYRVKLVTGEKLGEAHYVVEQTVPQNVGEERRMTVDTATVFSNNPDYNGTRYVRYADALNTIRDPNRGHDCVVEFPPDSEPQVIAKLHYEQAAANEAVLDIESHTFTVGDKTLAIPNLDKAHFIQFFSSTNRPAVSTMPQPEQRSTSLLGRFLKKK